MGAFGIYALVVTFIFVIYYVVMICLDLFGTKGEKKDKVEVIHTGIPATEAVETPVSSPVRVREGKDGQYEIEQEGKETEVYGGKSTTSSSHEQEVEVQSTPSESQVVSAEDISNMDDAELAKEAKAKIETFKKQLIPISPEIQGAISVDDRSENYKEALLQGMRVEREAKLLG